MTLVERAKYFASNAHLGMGYGNRPYAYHLQKVEDVLLRFRKGSAAMRCAAWLHDVIEDTAVTASELRKNFPAEVVRLVEAVTDVPGKDRRERKELTYPVIWIAGPDAVALKLADRIANVEESLGSNGNTKLLSMYRNEHREFRDALYEAGENDEMWEHMDRLASVKGTSA